MGSAAGRTCCQQLERERKSGSQVVSISAGSNHDCPVVALSEVAEPFEGTAADQSHAFNCRTTTCCRGDGELADKRENLGIMDIAVEATDEPEQQMQGTVRTGHSEARALVRRRGDQAECWQPSSCLTVQHAACTEFVLKEPASVQLQLAEAVTASLNAACSEAEVETSPAKPQTGQNKDGGAHKEVAAALLRRLEEPGMRLQVFEYNGWQDLQVGDANQCFHHLRTGGTRFAILSCQGMYIVDCTNPDSLFWMNLGNGKMSRLRMVQSGPEGEVALAN
mmetsp:Transcript_45060/g.107068  ORF Transcript_45060/g.107068 Transcript_45060/m.107068 type:complete len:279 (+) Transcript_45060:60-896(+)